LHTRRVGKEKMRKMTLKRFFEGEKHGSKREMADKLGISPTWLSLLINGSRQPSAALARKIEKATKGLVPAKTLRPDLFA